MTRHRLPLPRAAGASAPSTHDRAVQQVLSLSRSGRVGEAIDAARALLERAPRHPVVRNVLGVLLLEHGRSDEACALLEALAHELPQAAAVQVNAGNALLATGRPDDALRAFERAVRLEPEHAVNWYGLARARQLAGRPDLAIAAYETTLRLDPSHRRARANLAAALNFADRYAEGEQVARAAIASAPTDAGAHVNLAIALLSQGKWTEGWSAFEWRLRSSVVGDGRVPFTSPPWDGTPRPGTTLVVHAEQGLGDTLQFVRYLPRLRALGMRVFLVCQRSLVRLLQAHTPGTARDPDAVLADAVFPVGARVPSHDAHVSISSLAHRLRCHTDAEVCVHDRPYLSARRDALPVTDRPLRVGLVWAGSSTHVNDRNRSIALQAFRPLLEDPRLAWVNLQADIPEADVPLSSGMERALDGARDFVETARALVGTDLLVTVDSAMSHLAGALGHPTWVLLPRLGLDWRWCVGGVPDGWGETPWYRSVRTLRQQDAGDWSATLSQLHEALSTLAATRPPAARPVG